MDWGDDVCARGEILGEAVAAEEAESAEQPVLAILRAVKNVRLPTIVCLPHLQQVELRCLQSPYARPMRPPARNSIGEGPGHKIRQRD